MPHSMLSRKGCSCRCLLQALVEWRSHMVMLLVDSVQCTTRAAATAAAGTAVASAKWHTGARQGTGALPSSLLLLQLQLQQQQRCRLDGHCLLRQGLLLLRQLQHQVQQQAQQRYPTLLVLMHQAGQQQAQPLSISRPTQGPCSI